MIDSKTKFDFIIGRNSFLYISSAMLLIFLVEILLPNSFFFILKESRTDTIVLFITYIIFNRKIRIDIEIIVVILSFLAINLTASIIFSHFDIIKILSEGLSFTLFFAVLTSIKIKEDEIIKLLKIINIITLVLILIKIFSLFGIAPENIYLFLNRNSWSQTLMLPTFISFFLFVYTKNKLYLVCTGIYLYNTIFTFSRTAIISSIAFFIVYIFLTGKKKLKRNIGILIFLTIFISILMSEPVTEYIQDNYFRSGQYLLTGRDILWKIALEAFKTNPIFGVGRNSAIDLIRYSGTGMHNREYHSYYIEVLASGGLFSFLFFIYFISKSMKAIMLIYKNNIELGAILMGSLISTLIYMLAETFYPYAFSYNNAISGLFLFSIPIAYKNKNITLRRLL